MSDPRTSILEKAVQQSLEVCSISPGRDRLVVGLSGGPDSVALLDALLGLGVGVVAAHLDHGLRPGSSVDAAFCADFCRARAVEYCMGTADVQGRAAREHGGLEEAARRERYAFLRGIARERGLSWIAVAHTRDDQAETVLLRLLRGSGAPGLGGMRSRSRDVLRPLLAVGREDVLAHLASRGLSYREDPSNRDLSFLRNRVRHELIPYLEARFNPSVRAALARTAALLADESDLLRETTEALWHKAARRDGATVVLDRAILAEAAPAAARLIVRRAFEETGGLADVGTVHVDGAIRLGRPGAPSGRRLPVPGGRDVVCSFGDLRVGPRPSGEAFDLPLAVPGCVSLPDGRSMSAEIVASPEPPRGGAVVSAAGALTVRTRRPGDRIRTRGRSMSLRRFFMERRVPTTVRERMPLVAAGADVLWIPGQASAEPSDGRLVRLVLSGTA